MTDYKVHMLSTAGIAILTQDGHRVATIERADNVPQHEFQKACNGWVEWLQAQDVLSAINRDSIKF